jgi:hypothetical protein
VASISILTYFHLLHNQGGRIKIVNTIGHVLCVLLFMNGFMPSMLIAILIFLGSISNLGIRESMFCHCVASVRCLIILVSCLYFSLCHHNNSDSFSFANQQTDYLFCLINGLRDCVALGQCVLKEC